MTSISLRPVGADDLPEVWELHVRSEAHDGVPRAFVLEELEEELDDDEVVLATDTRLAIVDGRPVGYAYTRWFPSPVRLERAFMMNTTQADRNRLPQLGTAVIGGQPRITLTVRQQPGGTALGTYGYEAGDYQMLIQTSRDLASWDTRTLPLGIAESFTVSGTRFTTYYLQDPPGTPNGYRFMRVKVNRL